MRAFPPPLLSSGPPAVRLLLAGVVPAAFGLACGAVLGTSAAAFIAMQALAVSGGAWAGLEHVGPAPGAVRGLVGGTVFGTALLGGHALAGGPDHDLLPDPRPIQLAITAGAGALLGALGGWGRRRCEARMPKRA